MAAEEPDERRSDVPRPRGQVDHGCARRIPDEAGVAAAAIAAGIELRPLGYYANAAATPECAVAPGLLLGFSAVKPEAIRNGVEALARVIEGRWAGKPRFT